MDRHVRRSFCKKVSRRAYTLPLATALWCKHRRPSLKKNPFHLEKTLRTSFSSLASGKPTIPTQAAVRSGRRPSRSDAKRKRSALDSHSERGITENTICERSERRIKNDDLRAERVRVKIVLKIFLFSEFAHRKKWFKNSLKIV